MLVLLLAWPLPTSADEESPSEAASPDAPDEREPLVAPARQRGSAPPRIDYPPLQSLGSGGSSLYVDITYETTNDLSTFWWVRGRGRNYRVAVGGLFQVGGVDMHVEVPIQYTQLSIDSLMGLPPTDADQTKAAFSLGDIITGATYWWDLHAETVKTHLGLALRTRLPTHTTKYRFGLIDGSTLEFGFPYYLHVAPGLLLHASYGPLSITVNQGLLGMLARDVNLGGVLQQIPNVYFWESHVALDVALTDWLDFSTEIMSCVQLNRVEVENMRNLNNTRAVFITPAATVDLLGFRLAAAVRLGLPGRSTRDFGVITFSGSNAYMGRLSYMF